MISKKQNRTVIISGSSKGLGSYTTRYLAKNGFNVVINYNTHKKDAEALSKDLSQYTSVKVLKGDVSKFENVKSIVKKSINEFGSVDVLVNNAGIHIDNTVLNMDNTSWKKVIDTNLTGTFNFCKAVLPQMKKQHYGRIINIASFTGLVGIPGAANYAASKAGVIAFSKSLAKEVAKFGITVNAIAPGYFEIGMFKDLDKKFQKKILSDIPAERLGKPKEISELIKILISASYLTGQVFVLDGGYSA